MASAKGSNGKAARQSLAKSLLPVFSAIHRDFAEARRLTSVDLVDKLALLLLPAAFAAAPQLVKEAEKWRSQGLLGSGLLSAGRFPEFSLWVDEATKYVEQAGASLQELEPGVIRFYRLVNSRRAWDVRSAKLLLCRMR